MVVAITTVTVVLLGAVGTLMFLFYRKRQRQVTWFERRGIPGPRPHWLNGNLDQLYHDSKQEVHEVFQKWTRTYGKTFGYYEGCKPHIVTSDLDLIQEVLVKNFSKFYGRKIFSHMTQKDRDQGGMAIANGIRWKRLRAIINPTFSTAKLKTMVPTVMTKVINLEKNLSDVMDKPIEVVQYFQRFTLATIGNAAFGMNVDPQNDPSDPYLSRCRAVFSSMSPKNRPYFMKVVDMLPEMRQIFRLIINTIIRFSPVNKNLRWIGTNLDKVIDERRHQVRRPDLLQLMLDAEVESIDPAADECPMQENGYTLRTKTIERQLTNHEVQQQATIFMIAGYETTSTTLSYVTQMLAIHPEEQQKLIDEIDAVLPNKAPLTFTDVQNMEYLDMVLCETLRLYPAAAMAVVRECFDECTIKGIHFRKGTIVQVDVWSVHHSTEIWGPDVEEFIPERFRKEEHSKRHPMCWMPFGAGPKNCVGQRFAVMEIKLAFCYLLQRYRFERCELTQDPLPLQNNMVTVPKNGVTVRLVPRVFPEE